MKEPNTLALVGRLLFALPLLAFGAMHFAAGQVLAPRVPFPPQLFWVYLTGAALLAAGISVALKRYAIWALLGLALMLLVFDVTMHFPRAAMSVADISAQFNMSPETAKEFQGMNMVIGLMNVMLIGASLTMAGYLKFEERAR